MNKFPPAFVGNMQAILGDAYIAFESAMSRDVPVSVRLNPVKRIPYSWKSEPVPWCSHGFWLSERPSFIADPLFHAGAYYVQEASSMFIDTLLGSISEKLPEHPVILDLCAAPGGKSTLVSAFLNGKGLLVSNEVIRPRVRVLEENLMKWGYENVVITQNDPADFAKVKALFDVILVDAPCSGEGMFRKDTQAVNEWSEQHVMHCAARQERILREVVGSLKPGGFLIYSTCTYNRSENEEQVQRLMDEYGFTSVSSGIRVHPGIQEVTVWNERPLSAYRFFPHQLNGEGFFAACLQKPGEEYPDKLPSMPLPTVTPAVQQILQRWVREDEPVVFFKNGAGCYAINQRNAGVTGFLLSRLNVIRAGLCMGEMKQEELVPDHALALSRLLSVQVERTGLELNDARRFLKKDPLSNELFSGKGWKLITYGGLGIGWVKALGNRVNNYFPTHLRVLKNIYDETT